MSKAKEKAKAGAKAKSKASPDKPKRKSASLLLGDISTAAAAPAPKAVGAKKAAKAKAPKVAKPAKAAKQAKQAKVVRDSFTMPKADYDRIDALKKKCLNLGVSAKKTELLRAGLAALAGLADDKLVAAVRALDKVKTGRPSSGKKKTSKGKKK
ncbi:MAG: hypothetical protein ACKVQA_10325 [Burkholderiales bacterium]